MIVDPSKSERTTGNRELLWAVGCFAAVGGLAHFFYFRRMGLYEDDYIYTLGCFDWGWAKWWDELARAFTEPLQGRPLNHAFRRTLNFLTLRGDTLIFGQAASWLMLTLNACLLYRLARRHVGVLAALTAGLLYLLYPADTSRQILMHQSDLLFGTLLCLLGLHAFSKKRAWLGWFFGLCCLLNYESFYLPLLVAPLLASDDTDNSAFPWRACLRHAAVFVLLAGAVLGARALLGEARAAELGGGVWAAGAKSIQSMMLGPLVSLKAFGAAVPDVLRTPAPAHVILAMAGGASIGFALWHRCHAEDRGGTGVIRLALAGLFAWLLGYALCIRPDNSPPTVLIGRLTGMHVAGSLGFSLLAGALVHGFSTRMSQPKCACVLGAGLGVATALLTLHGLRIQEQEYAKHWAMQGRFWKQVMPLLADLRESEPVLLEMPDSGNAVPDTKGFPRFGMVNYAPVVLHRISTYPSSWKLAPRVFGVWKDCPFEDRPEGRLLRTPSWFWEGLWPVVRDKAFIYLKVQGDQIVRISGPVDICGKMIRARPQETGVVRLSPKRRFHALWPE